MAGKAWLDDGAEKIIADVMKRLGPGATPSEAIRYLNAQASKYERTVEETHRSNRRVQSRS